ncbi:MAG TPA: hypothetical protein VGI79_04055 [Caulobacteraceae bacterium]|jgi:MFS family permease
MVNLTTVCFCLITAYTPTLGRTELHLGVLDGLALTLCVGATNLLWLPVMGALSDKRGRKPSLFAFTGLAICTAYPAMQWLVGVNAALKVPRTAEVKFPSFAAQPAVWA